MERAKPNPDFLKKDDLRYEILIRNGGEQSDLKVPQLQKLLRELFSREVNLKVFENVEPVGELQTLFTKLDEIQDIVADCIMDNFVLTNQHKRICTRLQHLLNRAHELLGRNLLEECYVTKLRELFKQASGFIQSINELLSKVIVSNVNPQADSAFLQSSLNVLGIETSAAVQNDSSI
jgi:predicted nuclease with TOPRIM domain